MAEHAREAGWTQEEDLALILDRESPRNASGAQLRVGAGGFRAGKTIDEFNWDADPTVRQQIATLA